MKSSVSTSVELAAKLVELEKLLEAARVEVASLKKPQASEHMWNVDSGKPFTHVRKESEQRMVGLNVVLASPNWE